MYRPTIAGPGADLAPAPQAARPTDEGQRAAAGQERRRIVSVYLVGSPAANGSALLAALDEITAAADAPCLLTIAPGVYDLGAAALQMKVYVDIEGAGERSIVITSHVGARDSGTVIGADHA